MVQGYGGTRPVGSSDWAIRSQQMAFGERQQANQYELAQGQAIGGSIAAAPKLYMDAQLARMNLVQEELKRRKMQMDLDMADRLSQSDVAEAQAEIIRQQARAAQLQNDQAEHEFGKVKRNEMTTQNQASLFSAIVANGVPLKSGGYFAAGSVYKMTPGGRIQTQEATPEQLAEADEMMQQRGPGAQLLRDRQKHNLEMKEIEARSGAARAEAEASRAHRTAEREAQMQARKDQLQQQHDFRLQQLEANKELSEEKRKQELETLEKKHELELQQMQEEFKIRQPEMERKAGLEERRVRVQESRQKLAAELGKSKLELEKERLQVDREKASLASAKYNKPLIDSALNTVDSVIEQGQDTDGDWVGDPAKLSYLKRVKTDINNLATRLAASPATPETAEARRKDTREIEELAASIRDDETMQGPIFAQALVDDPQLAESRFNLSPSKIPEHRRFASNLGSLYDDDYRRYLTYVKNRRADPEAEFDLSKTPEEEARGLLYDQIEQSWRNPTSRAKDSTKVFFKMGYSRDQISKILEEELPGLSTEERAVIVDEAEESTRK